MNNSELGGLQFRYQELVGEIVALREMAQKFLEGNGADMLTALEKELDRIREMPTGSILELQLHPLRTRPTRSYEIGSRSGGIDIYAYVTGIWELRPLGQRGKPKRKVEFMGKASAKIEIWHKDYLWRERDSPDKRLAGWQIELGAHDSPGCYFHIQILGDRDAPPFPRSIPIPRMPSPFVTPMTAVEFVLGELFQDEWSQEASRACHHHSHWGAIQQKRLHCLLEWQKVAMRAGQSSPLMNLKEAKPPPNLFLGERI